MYSDLKGKNVLITWASSGIGQAIAYTFAAQWANIGINYAHSEEGARTTQQTIHDKYSWVQTVCLQADVSQEEQVVAMFNTFEKELWVLDVLINNSGIQQSTPSDQLSLQDFQKVINVNFTGAFLCAQQAVKSFLTNDTQWSVIMISSVHQIIPKPEYLSYSMSKWGIQNLTRTLALEYANKWIRVNAIGPWAVITPINDAWINNKNKKNAVEAHIPLWRAAESHEIWSVAAFLASQDASYITGQTLYVDGWLTLFPEFRNDRSSGWK